MRNRESEVRAIRAAKVFSRQAGFAHESEAIADTAVVLGTGWGSKLVLAASPPPVPLEQLPGFVHLHGRGLPGHRRALRCGTAAGRRVLVLDGRIHLNEAPASAAVPDMVRLQVEMLFHLGVKNLILTCAAGSLGSGVNVGDIVLVDGFVTLYAPPMPLWAGEFCSPEDALVDQGVLRRVLAVCPERTHIGGYAMVRGPFFEGRKYDKRILAASRADVVGMSMLPEACIAALYGVRVLGLCFVTNTASEEHSHEENVRRAEATGATLGALLERIIPLV